MALASICLPTMHCMTSCVLCVLPVHARSLSNNDLICNCDLYWLVEFINLRVVSGDPPLVSGAECTGMVNTDINDPSVDYSGCIGR